MKIQEIRNAETRIQMEWNKNEETQTDRNKRKTEMLKPTPFKMQKARQI